jgi:hypothetical protein
LFVKAQVVARQYFVATFMKALWECFKEQAGERDGIETTLGKGVDESDTGGAIF